MLSIFFVLPHQRGGFSSIPTRSGAVVQACAQDVFGIVIEVAKPQL